MNPIQLVILLVIAAAVIAFVLYKLGFRLDKLKVKLGLVETELSRKPSPPEQQPPPTTGAKIKQKASQGGVIKRSGIRAPADSLAEIDQQARDEKSKIDDSPIELK